MYIDAKLLFSDAQALASISSGSTSVSTSVRDLGASETDAFGTSITPDIGKAGKLVWHVRVNTALVGASAAIIAKLVTKAANASISASGTEIARHTFAATAAAGTKAEIPIPAGTVSRYLGVLYTASGAKLTSAKFDSFINMDLEAID